LRPPILKGSNMTKKSGHGFQDQESSFLTRSMVQKVPRSTPATAISRYPGAEYSPPGGSDDLSDLEKYQNQMMRAMRRQSNFQQLQSVAFNTTAELILPATERTYFFIQNVSAAALLYVGFGTQPSSGNGILIAAVNGWYEPFMVPQNDVWIVGNAAGTCNILYSND